MYGEIKKKKTVFPIWLIFSAQLAIDEKPSVRKFEIDGTFLL